MLYINFGVLKSKRKRYGNTYEKKLKKKSTRKWLTAVDEFTMFLRDFLGDDLVEIIASEYPELGYDGYNFIIIVRRELTDREKDRITLESDRICEKLNTDFSIIPLIEVKME